MCSCKNKSLGQGGQKSIKPTTKTLSGTVTGAKKTREQLLAELRQRISESTR